MLMYINKPSAAKGKIGGPGGRAKAMEPVESPAEYDILCGKSIAYKNHKGNIVFKKLIDSSQDKYAAAVTKEEKIAITKEIFGFLRYRYNSRFLKKTKTGLWEVISERLARDKVSHALRYACRTGGAQSPPSPFRKRSRTDNLLPFTNTCQEENVQEVDATRQVSGVPPHAALGSCDAPQLPQLMQPLPMPNLAQSSSAFCNNNNMVDTSTYNVSLDTPRIDCPNNMQEASLSNLDCSFSNASISPIETVSAGNFTVEAASAQQNVNLLRQVTLPVTLPVPKQAEGCCCWAPLSVGNFHGGGFFDMQPGNPNLSAADADDLQALLMAEPIADDDVNAVLDMFA